MYQEIRNSKMENMEMQRKNLIVLFINNQPGQISAEGDAGNKNDGCFVRPSCAFSERAGEDWRSL
jgi:hypothetical protein